MSTCTITEIEQQFRSFASEHGGTIHDVVSDESRLFGRCVLPHESWVVEGDRFRGGVAIHCDGLSVHVRPYLLRQICVNGAIRTSSGDATSLALSDCTPKVLQAAMEAAGSARAFEDCMRGMRSLVNQRFDMAMMLGSMISEHFRYDDHLLLNIIDRYGKDRDLTAYGWFNAVTAVARETPDPAWRWRLEEIAGGLPALLIDEPEDRFGFDALELPTEARSFATLA